MVQHEGGSITCTVVSGIDEPESNQALRAIFQSIKKNMGHREIKWPPKEANGHATWKLIGFLQQVNGKNRGEVGENGQFS